MEIKNNDPAENGLEKFTKVLNLHNKPNEIKFKEYQMRLNQLLNLHRKGNHK